MAYSEPLAQRIREKLVGLKKLEEKEMFGGLAFMLNAKMCVGVIGDEMMCRIDPDVFDEALERNGCRPMIHGKRTMKGFVFVSEEGYKRKKEFDYWVDLALDFNKRAKPSKKKK